MHVVTVFLLKQFVEFYILTFVKKEKLLLHRRCW